MSLRRVFATVALAFAATMTAQAAVAPSMYHDLGWRFIGPFRGGRVLTVTGVPGDSRHF